MPFAQLKIALRQEFSVQHLPVYFPCIVKVKLGKNYNNRLSKLSCGASTIDFWQNSLIYMTMHSTRVEGNICSLHNPQPVIL